jgi:cytoskeletal protein RodZ
VIPYRPLPLGEAEVSDQPVRASRRHWLRISIRSLIILVLVAGGWLGWLVRSARIQREAVDANENQLIASGRR